VITVSSALATELATEASEGLVVESLVTMLVLSLVSVASVLAVGRGTVAILTVGRSTVAVLTVGRSTVAVLTVGRSTVAVLTVAVLTVGRSTVGVTESATTVAAIVVRPWVAVILLAVGTDVLRGNILLSGVEGIVIVAVSELGLSMRETALQMTAVFTISAKDGAVKALGVAWANLWV